MLDLLINLLISDRCVANTSDRKRFFLSFLSLKKDEQVH